MLRRFIPPLLPLATALLWSTLQAQPVTTFDGPPRRLMGPEVNSRSIEIVPLVSSDGATLFFDRKYDSSSTGGAEDEDEIWVSQRQPDGAWSTARSLGPPLNTTGSDVIFWTSYDGDVALVYNGDLVQAGEIGLGISRRVAGMWSRPEPITIEGLESLGEVYYASISPDERHLFLSFAADTTRPEDYDLFVSNATSFDLRRWGRPEPLVLLNTTFGEEAPFMAADNRTLYFASSGQPGLGRTDLFITRRLGDSWVQWSEPQNLGPRVNTPAYESSLSIAHGDAWAYMSSEGEYGHTDIYRVRLPDDMLPAPTLTIRGRFAPAGQPAAGLVRALDADGREVSSTASGPDGRFLLFLPPIGSYRLVGWSGDGEGSIGVTGSDSSGGVLRVTLGPQEPERGASSVALSRLVIDEFAVGSSILPKEGIVRLRTLARDLAEQKGVEKMTLRIIGHTDVQGGVEGNRRLSEERARGVLEWLHANGLPRDAMVLEGRGDLEPVVSRVNPAGWGRNRRVEVIVTVERRE